jgi:hypothetical protein
MRITPGADYPAPAMSPSNAMITGSTGFQSTSRDFFYPGTWPVSSGRQFLNVTLFISMVFIDSRSSTPLI